MDAYDVKGRWWRPEAPDVEVVGDLHFSDSRGIRLELQGTLHPEEEQSPFELRKGGRGVLNGVSSSGTLMTLVEAEQINSSRSFPGYGRESYMARYVLREACIEKAEDLTFDGHYLRYNGLSDWWSKSGIKTSPIEVDDSCHRALLCSYTEQDPVIVSLPQAELSVRLAWSHGCTRRRAEVGETVDLRVRTKEPLTLSAWGDQYESALREFLTLAMGRPTLLDEWTAESPGVLMEINGSTHRRPMHVDVAQHEPSELDSAWSPREMLFSLDEIEGVLGETVTRWLEIRDRYTLARQLYFSTRYAPYLYAQTELVYLTQACESYHTIRFKNRGRVSADAHARAVEEVMEAVPAQHRDWVGPKLQGRPGISLASRLLFLCQRHEGVVQPLLKDVEGFCDSVAATRHYLTHGTRRPPTVMTDMLQIIYATWVLRILFEACLLEELGLTPDVLPTPFEGSSRYEHLSANPLE